MLAGRTPKDMMDELVSLQNEGDTSAVKGVRTWHRISAVLEKNTIELSRIVEVDCESIGEEYLRTEKQTPRCSPDKVSR